MNAFTAVSTLKHLVLAGVSVTSVFVADLASAQEVTPYRPGAGSPAVVSAPNHFELETGVDVSKGGGTRVAQIGGLLKYGISDSLGVMVGFSPWGWVKTGNQSISGASDLALGVKWITPLSKSTAAGLQWIATAPTGSAGFKYGGYTDTVTGIVGLDFAGYHSDLNLGFTHYSKVSPGFSRTRVNWSASLGRNITGPWSAALEVSGNRQSGNANGVQLLASVGYKVNKQLVLDGYVARARISPVGGSNFNLNSTGVGLTYMFAK